MEITVERKYKKAEYTIGVLSIDGERFCDTLEDTDRGLRDFMTPSQILANKIKGVTAIPTGRYPLRWTYSPKFKRSLPLIDRVKGFEGIRIHSGNTASDSLGCILLGENKEKGKVLNSRVVCERFYKIVRETAKREKIWITIR